MMTASERGKQPYRSNCCSVSVLWFYLYKINNNIFRYSSLIIKGIAREEEATKKRQRECSMYERGVKCDKPPQINT
jgi:hypothetical protein